MKEKFSDKSIINLVKKTNVKTVSKDCIPVIDKMIENKLEQIIDMIISINDSKIYNIDDIAFAIKLLENKY